MTTSLGRTMPMLEKRLFRGAVALGLLHAVDEAVLNRQPGVPDGQHLPALAAATIVGWQQRRCSRGCARDCAQGSPWGSGP
jgi:hypothetical protein